jgi:hypothetical protein
MVPSSLAKKQSFSGRQEDSSQRAEGTQGRETAHHHTTNILSSLKELINKKNKHVSK